MKVIDVYKQYFEADAEFSGVKRHGVSVTLTATSDEGTIKYDVGISFFPHNDPDDFGISYDAYFEKNIYIAKGRRSKKKEKAFLDELRNHADELAESADGKIFWDKPLIEARLG